MKLRRDTQNGYIGGVCSGIAKVTDTSPIGWRILFLLVPSSLWIYLALWVILKEE